MADCFTVELSNSYIELTLNKLLANNYSGVNIAIIFYFKQFWSAILRISLNQKYPARHVFELHIVKSFYIVTKERAS